jgi:hypothetical protein
LAYVAGYIGISLFDPWARFSPWLHVLAFGALVALGLITVVGLLWAGPSGFAAARNINWRLFPWVRLALFGAFLMFGLYQAGADIGRRLYVAFTPAYLTPMPQMRLAVTLTPPAYTGLKPVILASNIETPSGQLLGGKPVRVPAGSIITVTAQNTRWQPSLVWGRRAVGLRPLKSGGFQIAGKIEADTDVEIRQGSKRLAAWPIEVSADHTPEARVTVAPTVTPRGLLKFHVVATDDYGVSYLGLKMRLKDDMNGVEKLVDLPSYGTRGIDEEEYVNLLSHPWAGKPVVVLVAALDGAGQEGTSAPYEFVLPQSQFHSPLARALNEARKNVMAGGEGPRIAQGSLQALLSGSGAAHPDVTSYLGLRTAYLRLENDPASEHAQEVADLLWDLAVRAEDGGLASARDDLDQALDQLRFAVKKGASKADVSGLVGRLAWAFRGYDDARRKVSQEVEPGTASLAGIRLDDLKEGLDWPALTKFLNRTVDLANKGDYAKVASDLDGLKDSFEDRGDLLFSAGAYRRFLVASYAHQTLLAVKEGQQNLLAALGSDPQDQGARQKIAARQKALQVTLDQMARNLAMVGLGPYDAVGKARRLMEEARVLIGQNKLADASLAQSQTLGVLDKAFKVLAEVPSPVGESWKRSGEDPLGRPLPELSRSLNSEAKAKPLAEAVAAPGK